MNFRHLLAILALFATIALSTLVSTGSESAADPTITITNFAFTPAELTIPKGTKVVFKNEDDTIHSIVADDGSFHSAGLDTGDEFTFTFATTGIVSYHCGLHPFMVGKIIVQ